MLSILKIVIVILYHIYRLYTQAASSTLLLFSGASTTADTGDRMADVLDQGGFWS